MADGVFDLVINHGTIVNAWGSTPGNVGMKDGKITAVSTEPLSGADEIDASDMLLLPGLIDAHTHLQPRLAEEEPSTIIEWCDDFEKGTISAAFGGVTTVVDFAVQEQEPDARLRDVVERYIRIAEQTAVVDFGLHGGVTYPSKETLEELPGLVRDGVASFKFFRTYKRWGIFSGLGFMLEAFEAIAKAGGVAAVHCENDEIIDYLRAQYLDAGLERELIWHARSRPPVAEEIAIEEVAALARVTGASMYPVHLNSSLGLDAVRRSKALSDDFHCEVGLHFLFFTEDVFTGPDAPLYFMTPPFRREEDIEALWGGLSDGSIDWVATDHSPHLRREKLADPRFAPSKEGAEFAIPPGFTGSEEMLQLIYTHGVLKGRFDLPRLVALLSANPAEALGLQSKGAIEPGKDADIAVFDPRPTSTITIDRLHTAADYTIYEGMDVVGETSVTISRGDVIVRDGRLLGTAGRGRYIRRSLQGDGDKAGA
jgi:dihydropyrimidinase